MSFVIFLLLCFPVWSQTSSITDKMAAEFQRVVDQNKTIGVAGGVFVASADEHIETFAAGYSDASTKKAFTPTTLSRTASITKPITAIAIMQLVEQGKLNLDDKVSQYIPTFSKSGLNAITIRHLLQHTSGIGAYKNKKEAFNQTHYDSLEEALEIFVDRKLRFTPGSDFGYTTYGYVVLGILIEKASSKSYEDYIQDNIFNVADMQNTSIEECNVQYKNKSKLYEVTKQGTIKEGAENNISDRLPGGGVQSTVEDLLKFGKAILNNELVSDSSLQQMILDHGLKKEGNGYGLGWYLYGVGDYGNVFGHNGSQMGCSSFLFILPDSNMVTVVLSNTLNFEENGSLAIALFQVGKALVD